MSQAKTVGTGTRIFIDSNIFIFAALHTDTLGQASLELLRRVKDCDLYGYTATCVVTEATHRFMVKETRDHLKLSSAEAVSYLQKHPEYVRTLKRHLGVASYIGSLHVDILPVTVNDLHASKEARSTYGLLANDSLIVGVMKGHRLHHLATNDRGFLRVPTLAVWMPRG